MSTKVGLPDQIKEAERELAMRKSAYPKWVEAKKMTQEDADRHINAMAYIVSTLKFLQQYERPFKETIKRVMDAKQDPAVDTLLAGIPGSEVHDVRDKEEAAA